MEENKNISFQPKREPYDWAKEEPMDAILDVEQLEAFLDQRSIPKRNREEIFKKRTAREIFYTLAAVVTVCGIILGTAYGLSTSEERKIEDLSEDLSVSASVDVVHTCESFLEDDMTDEFKEDLEAYQIDQVIARCNEIEKYLNKNDITSEETQTLAMLEQDFATTQLERVEEFILNYTKNRCLNTLKETNEEMYNIDNYPKVEIKDSFESGEGRRNINICLYTNENSTYVAEYIPVKSNDIEDCLDALYAVRALKGDTATYEGLTNYQEAIYVTKTAIATIAVNDQSTLQAKMETKDNAKVKCIKEV